MKKFRVLLVALMLVLTMALFTGCGKVETPTQADVEAALSDEGYIPGSEKDKDDEEDEDEPDKDSEDESDEDAGEETGESGKETWSVKINKNRLNDDKDEATVRCTLTISDGYYQTEQDFKIDFELNDDKEWECDKVKPGDEIVGKLVKGIDDEEAKRLIESQNFSVEADDISGYVYSEDISSITIGEHTEDFENSKDIVSVTIEGEAGYKICKFDADITFFYNDGWYYYDNEITGSPSIDYVDSYKNGPSADDIEKGMLEDDGYVYAFGGYFYHADSTFEVTEVEKFDYSEGVSSTYIPFKYTLSDGGFEFEVEAEAYMYYEDDEWVYSYTNTVDTVVTKTPFEGTWAGTFKSNDAADKVTIAIGNEYNDNGYLVGEVTYESAENGKYSYTIGIYRFDRESGKINTSAGDWIVEPNTDNYVSAETFSGGILSGDTWTCDDSWNTFSLKRS